MRRTTLPALEVFEWLARLCELNSGERDRRAATAIDNIAANPGIGRLTNGQMRTEGRCRGRIAVDVDVVTADDTPLVAETTGPASGSYGHRPRCRGPCAALSLGQKRG